jgi:hypothetical protein
MKSQNELTEKEFIERQASKLKNGFSDEQIIDETWQYALVRLHCSVKLEGIIQKAMLLYRRIIFEYLSEEF